MSVDGSQDVLVLFSASIPCELTIEKELSVVAERFSKVLYLPSVMSADSKDQPSLPQNVEIVDVLARDQKGSAVSSLPAAGSIFARAALRPENASAYRRHFRTYWRLLQTQLGRARVLEEFVRERGLQGALFYDYWFENSTLALALLRSRGVIRRCLARAHRFDLYDDPDNNWVVPFREFKATHLDRIMPISDDGKSYLKARLPRRLHQKVVVSRLGVPDQEVRPRTEGVPLLVSVSHMHPHKRVQDLPLLLTGIETPLKWVHFGEGPMLEETKRRAAELPDHIDWELRGRVPHEEVLRFYRENAVSLFASLSISEGIPVSMMEAMSFGVPVLAYAVCGIPELVTDRSGVLLDPSVSMDEACGALSRALDPAAFDSKEIVAFQRDRFGVQKNYEDFTEIIKRI